MYQVRLSSLIKATADIFKAFCAFSALIKPSLWDDPSSEIYPADTKPEMTVYS